MRLLSTIRHWLAPFVVFLLAASSVLAAPTDPEAPPSSPDEGSGIVHTPNTPRTPRVYPAAGFHEGFMSVVIANGKTIAPSGSFIDHERAYDSTLRLRNATGSIPSLVPGMTLPIFTSEILPRENVSGELEYALNSYFGAGIFASYLRIDISRQDMVPLSETFRRPTIEPVPLTRTLYRGNLGGALVSFHPLPGRRFDPYLELRAGGGGFTGQAHALLDFDPYQATNRIRNGTAAVYGGNLGLNVHVPYALFLRFEAGASRQFLKSNLFSSRGLSSYEAMFGVGTNLEAFSP